MRLTKTKIRCFIRQLKRTFMNYLLSEDRYDHGFAELHLLVELRSMGYYLGIFRWSPCCPLLDKAHDLRRDLPRRRGIKPGAANRMATPVFNEVVESILTPRAKRVLEKKGK